MYLLGYLDDKFNKSLLQSNKKIAIALNLTTNPPPLVSNCTDVEFSCNIIKSDEEYKLNSSSIFWTFKNSNVSVSSLPGGRVDNEDPNVSKLNIDCAQFAVHNGDYMCHLGYNDDEQTIPGQIVNSSSVILDVFGKSSDCDP